MLEVSWILINLSYSEQASEILFANADEQQCDDSGAMNGQPMLSKLIGNILKNNKKDLTMLEFYLTTISNITLNNPEMANEIN